MYEETNKKQKTIFNFLYVNRVDDMNSIYDQVKNNKIECNNEYLDKCKLIQKLFLKKIKNGMSYQTYNNYKIALKKLDTNTYPMYIDNLISIFNVSDKKIMKMIYKEKLKGSYNCLTPSIRNSEIKITPALVIDMLNENYGNMKLMVSRYVSNLLKDKNKDEIISIYNDVINKDDFYTIVLKEMFINKFAYLEKTIYKDIYVTFISNLNSTFKTYLKSVITSYSRVEINKDELKFNSFERVHCVGYGYYKKYKDYRK